MTKREIGASDEDLADALVGRRITSLGVMRNEYSHEVERLALRLDNGRTIELVLVVHYDDAELEIHDITPDREDDEMNNLSLFGD